MSAPDLNLLVALDVLLAEESVAKAGRRLRLSPSAMSRALERLRRITGDPLLVRAGRGLVSSPRAIAMRDEVARLVRDAQAVLRPSDGLDLVSLERSFAIRTSDGFAETFGPELIRIVGDEAPGVRLAFVRKLDKDSAGLREGAIDLETGVVDKSIGPEIRAQALFADRYVAVVRAHHPLTRGMVTPQLYAGARHAVVERRGLHSEQIDEALDMLGLRRNVAVAVDGFAAALAMAAGSDLVATVPERHTAGLRDGMFAFPLPFPAEGFTVSLLWHPRMDGDPAHRWLRECLRRACGSSA
ncbi:MAG TPA: LysR family transcriptional regulator [Croceibacterium sp.]|nr:LysR family transcriptional regulator [Croceibacterium sp.]